MNKNDEITKHFEKEGDLDALLLYEMRKQGLEAKIDMMTILAIIFVGSMLNSKDVIAAGLLGSLIFIFLVLAIIRYYKKDQYVGRVHTAVVGKKK